MIASPWYGTDAMTNLIETLGHGAIRELKLARAPVNALNPDLCRAVRDGVAQAVADGVSGLVLSGGPKVFSAGLDVPHLLSLPDRAALTAAWGDFFGAARALAESPVPVVAAIAGHAPAGGCVLALCCDYRIMASGPFRIGLNETQVGLAVPEGIQQLLRRVVGPHRAERLLVSGEMVEAERALALGLVDELVDIDHVAVRAVAWLEDLLKLPRKPMLQTRALARADLVAALQPERVPLDRFVDDWNDPDTQAGLRALVAKLGK
jgi:enoyl-CoA hydratase/carnithine racemase